MEQGSILKAITEKSKEIQGTRSELNKEIAYKVSQLGRLMEISKASADLINGLSLRGNREQISNLRYLSKIEEAIVETDPKEIKNAKNEISNILIGKIWKLIEQTLGNPKKQANAVDLLQIEAAITRLLKYCEINRLIPITEEKSGWKALSKVHEPLINKIEQMRRSRSD